MVSDIACTYGASQESPISCYLDIEFAFWYKAAFGTGILAVDLPPIQGHTRNFGGQNSTKMYSAT